MGKRREEKLLNEADTGGAGFFFFLSLALVVMGPLPRLGLRPKRVPCVPQMGLLNMKGRHVQMANFARAESRDKWAKQTKDWNTP